MNIIWTLEKYLYNIKRNNNRQKMIQIVESETDKEIYFGKKLSKEEKLAFEEVFKDFGGYEDR